LKLSGTVEVDETFIGVGKKITYRELTA